MPDVTYGPLKTFDSGASQTRWINIAKLTATTALVVWREDTQASPNKGSAYVATISGTDITFGAKKTIEDVSDMEIRALSSTSALMCFFGNGTNTGRSRVLTISGTDITVGAAHTHQNENSAFNIIALLSPTKFVVGYRDQTPTAGSGAARVGTISGTDITFGTQADFAPGGILGALPHMVEIDSTHCVVCYSDSGDTFRGVAKVGTISGTDLTFGTGTQFQPNANSSGASNISCDFLDTNKFVVMYFNSSLKGACKIGTVSGITITFGAEAQWMTGTPTGTLRIRPQYCTKLDTDSFFVIYQDNTDSNHGTGKIGTVSGTTITYSAEVEFLSVNGVEHMGFDILSSTVGLVGFEDTSDTNNGKLTVATFSGLVPSVSFTLLLAPPNLQGNIDTHIGKGMQ